MLDLTFGKHGGVIPIPERHLEAQLHLNSLFKFVIMPTMSIFLGKEVMDNVSSYLGWGGGRVEEGAAMECRVGRYIVKEHSEWDEGYFEVLNAVPCEPRLVGELKSLYREEIGEEDEKWPALGSNQPLDLRMLDENGQSRRLEGASAVAAKLNPDFRPHEPLDRRFAFLYGPPYFVLSELDKRCSCLPLQHSPPWPLTPPPTSSVIHEGRSYLLIGDLNSSVADPEDGAVPSVPFLGLWTALLLFHLPDFEIERPSEERIEVLGEAGRELEKRDVERLRKVEGHSGLNKILDGSMLGSERLWKAGDSVRSATIFSSSRLSEDEGWVSFFEEEGVKLSLRHRLDSDITCDAEAYQHSRMVAIGVEFECENVRSPGLRLDYISSNRPSPPSFMTD
ncbi:BQ2448_1963 [Microbotryum intermedium]|uniref:BQ2448_1963 protein n=1 Tax=Microbotryum intermedium TaxID=269621 RepID=A0A238FAB0_9BASI|nr:BQ2448_1963 [Microbotryum intermedium]